MTNEKSQIAREERIHKSLILDLSFLICHCEDSFSGRRACAVEKILFQPGKNFMLHSIEFLMPLCAPPRMKMPLRSWRAVFIPPGHSMAKRIRGMAVSAMTQVRLDPS